MTDIEYRIREALEGHGFRKWGDRLDDANWVFCLCGEKLEGRQKWQTLLAAHQAAVLAGIVQEATAGAAAQALRDAASELAGLQYVRPNDEGRPKYEAMLAIRRGNTDGWLRARADRITNEGT